ncbi:MAG TPA: hypothetical protein PLZ73_07495 [bacterium]|nr:hypothetical protein [bacterium]
MRVIVVSIIVLLSGCSGHSDSGFQRQRFVADAESRKVIKLSDYTDFPWEHFYVFAPYTPEARVRKEVGRSVAFRHADSEGYCLLVFVRAGEVERSFEEGRYPVDFCDISRSGGYTRDEAVFKSVRDGKRYSLKPADQGVSANGASRPR